MTLFLFILVNIAAIAYLRFVMKRNLHSLEILVYWCISAIVIQNISAILFLKFELIKLSEIASLNWADVINRTVLVPILTITILNYYVTLQSLLKKLVLISIYVTILTGIEWLSEWTNLFFHADSWQLWWSFALNALVIVVTLTSLKVIRHTFYRKDKANGFYV
ncbi:hypothetical protein CIB95_11470 [Lottiidibacillus patelloidae]|uniref:Uncharacterized protein n=1 Tax=Lottiidibacillus patelloidae TaxID=2670334 RepID=A0A263BS41_9BACI|nr:CBO0543 family protein [Lottiidibacillus patelloidae]OZM56388.1 hypothetical protein CIB95_11470 [Lottiidibacillus patelloidae]